MVLRVRQPYTVLSPSATVPVTIITSIGNRTSDSVTVNSVTPISMVATTHAWTATLSATVPSTTKVGDKLTQSSNNYLIYAISGSDLTLVSDTTIAGTTTATAPQTGSATTSRMFSTLPSWAAGTTASLIAKNWIWRGELYKEGTGTNGEWVGQSTIQCDLAGDYINNNAALGFFRYMHLTAADGQAFNDHPNKNTNRLNYNSEYGVAIRMTSSYTTIQGSGKLLISNIQYWNNAPQGNSISYFYGGGDLNCDKCIIKGLDSVQGGSKFTNCLFLNTGTLFRNAGPINFRNCTIVTYSPPVGYYGAMSFMNAGYSSNNNYVNTAIFRTGFASYDNIGTSTQNAVTDLSTLKNGDNSTNKLNCVFENQFRGPVHSDTYYDFRARPDSDLARAAFRDQSNTGDLDILKNARSTTAPTVGCHEALTTLYSGKGTSLFIGKVNKPLIRQTQQPQASTQIDWSNPLTRGLILAVSDNYDAVNNRLITFDSRVDRRATTIGRGWYRDDFLTANPAMTNDSKVKLAAADSVHTVGAFAKANTRSLNGANFEYFYLGRWGHDSKMYWYPAQNQFIALYFDGSNVAQYLQSFADYKSQFTRGTTAVAQWDGATGRLFIDGIQAASTSIPTLNTATNSNIEIGSQSAYYTYHWVGWLPLFVAWNRALSATELKNWNNNPWQIFKPTQSKIYSFQYGYSENTRPQSQAITTKTNGEDQTIQDTSLKLHLDAAQVRSYPGTGTVWTDLSGNANTGTLVGGPTFSNEAGGVIVFDGTDDFVISPSISNIGNSNRTVDTWFKVLSYSASGYKRIFTLGGNTITDAPALSLAFQATSTSFSVGMGGFPYDCVINLPAISLNTWYNITCSVSGNTLSVYLNGQLQGTDTNSGPIEQNGFVHLARFNAYYGQYANCAISSFKLYNRVLSADEIANLYNQTKNRFTNTIDCGVGTYFTKTITGNTTLSLANVPSGVVYKFALRLTVNSGTVTWWSGVTWPESNAPYLTPGRSHLLIFQTRNGGTSWRGSYVLDYAS